MDSKNIRVFLIAAMCLLAFMLYTSWEQEHTNSLHPATQEQVESPASAALSSSENFIPESSVVTEVKELPKKIINENLIKVDTDTLELFIDLQGGNIVKAQLREYPKTKDSEEGFVLLDHSDSRYYMAQSGLLNPKGPDNKYGHALFSSAQKEYQLEPTADKLTVELFWENEDGVEITKSFIFHRGNYLLDVKYTIQNPTKKTFNGEVYGQLTRRATTQKSNGFVGMQMYQGGALYTPEKPYTKISFDKMKAENFSQNVTGGWAAMVEHYFLSAWVPDKDINHRYYTKVYSGNQYAIGAITPVRVEAGESKSINSQLYIGPEITEKLKAIHKGLDLTVDYGILWPISQVIFTVLKKVNSFIGNWGWSIIIVTLLIKLLFYKLSAASYRSMGRLRQVQPKMEALKQKHGDDKQALSQGMMDLYRKEKINPLGGCLPILIQIPVFIALYYVLLESVELRQAPFMFWIQDLSIKDPYYVLPILMGASMLFQQKLNPAPQDPVQAKVMLFLPLFFTVIFLTFPAGLVLYWVVNNCLSIIQQMYIMHKLEKEGLSAPKKKAKPPLKT